MTIQESFKRQIEKVISDEHPSNTTKVKVSVFASEDRIYLTVLTTLDLSREDTKSLFFPVFRSPEFSGYDKHVRVSCFFEDWGINKERNQIINEMETSR